MGTIRYFNIIISKISIIMHKNKGLIEMWPNFEPNFSKYLFIKCYSKMSGIYAYIPSVKFYIPSIKNDILNAFQYSS